MRKLTQTTIFSLAALGFFPFAYTNAYAADQNSYRAGSPYLKTVAHNYQQCAQQCKGDAACRGWNFVRPNAGSMSGVCEFNSRDVAPTSSPISMSGVITTSVDPLMSRAVSAGTHTIRVGSPLVPQAGQVISRRGKTIVKRQAIPQRQRAVRPAAHTRPARKTTQPYVTNTRNPDPRAPRVYGAAPQIKAKPAIDKRAALTKTQPRQPQLTPEQAYYRDQYLAQKRKQQAALLQQRKRPLQNLAPQAPIQMQKNQPRQRVRPAVSQAFHAPQQSLQKQPLYGSLHDDLTKNMTTVPRPRTAPDNIANPNAPVATSRAAPVKPVQSAPLTKPAGPQLAGQQQ